MYEKRMHVWDMYDNVYIHMASNILTNEHSGENKINRKWQDKQTKTTKTSAMESRKQDHTDM